MAGNPTGKPLSSSAWAALGSISHSARPRQEFNPGVTGKLVSMELVSIESRPSPYASHKPGTRTEFAVITAKGIAALQERSASA